MTPRQQRALDAQIDDDSEIEFLRVLSAAVIGRVVMDLSLTREDLRLNALFYVFSPDFACFAGICGYSEAQLPTMRAKLIQRWKDGLAKLA